MAPELISSLSLWQEPFMQRALIGGVISGILGGWVGSIAVLRQLSFFAEALGQASERPQTVQRGREDSTSQVQPSYCPVQLEAVSG